MHRTWENGGFDVLLPAVLPAPTWARSTSSRSPKIDLHLMLPSNSVGSEGITIAP